MTDNKTATPEAAPVGGQAVPDAMVDAYLQAQRATVEEADRMFGRPNIGGLHTNTVREACRAGLAAALAASPAPAQPAESKAAVPLTALHLIEDAAQAHDQCRAVVHMALSLAEVYVARAAILAGSPSAPVEIIGESSATTMEYLGDLLSNMDAVEEADEWLDPIFEAAQARWPVADPAPSQPVAAPGAAQQVPKDSQ